MQSLYKLLLYNRTTLIQINLKKTQILNCGGLISSPYSISIFLTAALHTLLSSIPKFHFQQYHRSEHRVVEISRLCKSIIQSTSQQDREVPWGLFAGYRHESRFAPLCRISRLLNELYCSRN